MPQSQRRLGSFLRIEVTLAICALSLSLGLGCATTPAGPPFSPAAAPPEHRSQVYIYRVDPRASLASVDIEIDGRPVGRFQDAEYETFELAAGPHQLKASMRGLAFVSLGWNQHRFRTRPGEAVYLEVSVRLADRTIPDSPSLEIAGRSSAGGSENVFLIERGAKEALERLQGTTRIVPNGEPTSWP
jgi:hypothetical protein